MSNSSSNKDDMFLGGNRTFTQSFPRSSTITKIVHDGIVNSMEVYFANGSVYRYYEISRKTARRLASAESAGKWFSRYIKNHYGFIKVSGSGSMPMSMVRPTPATSNRYSTEE